MKVHLIRSLVGVVAALACSTALAAEPGKTQGEGTLWENSHRKHVDGYEGTKTCIECHEEEAKDVFKSVHYQWKADASKNIVNSKGKKLGKINVTNDFCTNPSISWIAILTNDQGKVIGNGCSKCHTGLGLKPSDQMSQAQLENIDCLICHAPSYRREVVKKEDGTLAWVPTAMKNPEAMLNIAQNVVKSSTEMCMRCHVGSGGGLNFKRGDIEPKHARADREFDVHMGSGMQCIQCHKFKDHQVLGSGTQIGGQDHPGANPACESCHKGQVHAKKELNQHTKSVYCTTCHIPTFAKKSSTDMHRDWSKSEFIKADNRYEPEIVFKDDVKPVYAWWNGTGRIALLDEPVTMEPNGKVSLYKPEGSIKDPKAKIYAFKYHTAKLPIDNATKLMIPVKVGIVFKTGKNDPAVKAGAKDWFGKDVSDVGWIETERYMGIFHEVVPKEDALKCNDCHEGGARMDWKALGYKGDPKKAGGRKLPPPAKVATKP